MDLAGFFAVVAIVVVTPGPDMALVMRNTLAAGGVSARVRRALERVTGAVLVALGVRLAVARR